MVDSNRLKTKKCVTCGGSFTNFRVEKTGRCRYATAEKWESRQFCRNSCRRWSGQEVKECAACGKSYRRAVKLENGKYRRINLKKWNKSQWCSHDCRWAMQGAVYKQKPCAWCGRLFDNRIHTGKRKGSVVDSARFAARKHCSISCGQNARQNKRTILQDFLKHVTNPDANGCWIWLGHCHHFGHGRMEHRDIGGRAVLAHRLSYALFRGAVPARRIVCHDCNVPSCVNPHHLYLGDYVTNGADRAGLARPNAKDTPLSWPALHIDESGKLVETR